MSLEAKRESLNEMHDDSRGSLRPRGRRLGGPPPRIALGVDTLEHHYQSAIVTGAARTAKERGASLLVFCGGLGRDRQNSAQGDSTGAPTNLFDLLPDAHVTGLVLLTGTLTSSEPEALVRQHLHTFGGNKLVSVGIETSDSHHVLVENREGMFTAVEHLLRDHGRRKVILLRGPRTNREAEERHAAYCDALRAHDLAYDEQLVVQCDFQSGSGTRAVHTLLDERKLTLDDFDALVSADDLMALEAIAEFSKRKIRVPDDVAVFGFDDVDEARFCNPPLSSVRQPLGELGRESIRLLLAQHEEPQDLQLNTSPQFRRSCGCAFENVSVSLPPAAHDLTHDLEANLIRRREVLLAEMTRSVRAGFVSGARGWENKLFNSLQDEFQGKKGSFRKAFDDLLELSLATDCDTRMASELITALRKQLAPCAGDDPAAIRMVEGLLHEARILTGDVLERAQAQERIRHANWSQTLGEVSSRLVTAASFDELAETMQLQLPRLGVRRGAIVRLQAPDSAHVLAGYSAQVRMQASERIQQSRRVILPSALHGVDERLTLVVEPLILERRFAGYLVFEWAELPGYVYAVLRQILTAAVLSCQHSVPATQRPT